MHTNNIMVITVALYSAYVVENSSSEAQNTKSLGIKLELEAAENIWWKSNFKQICFYFMNTPIVSED